MRATGLGWGHHRLEDGRAGAITTPGIPATRLRRGLAAAALVAVAVPLTPSVAAAADTPAIGVTLAAGATELAAEGTTTLTVTVTNHGVAATDDSPVVHVRGTAAGNAIVATDDRCSPGNSSNTPAASSDVGQICTDPDPLAPGASVSWDLEYQAGAAGGPDTITVTTDFPADADPDDDTAAITLTAPHVDRVDLRVGFVPDTVTHAAGEPIRHEVRYSNNGPDPAHTGHLSFHSSEPTTFATEDLPDGVTCTGGDSLECDVALIEAGTTASLFFTTTAPARSPGDPRPMTLTVTVDSADDEADHADNSDSTDVTVAADATAAIDTDLGAWAFVSAHEQYRGESYDWTVTVYNGGPPAADAVVTMTLPTGLDPTTPAGATAEPTDGGTVITWQVTDLQRGEQRPLVLTTTPSAVGTYTVTTGATPAAGFADRNPLNDSHRSQITVIDPDLAVAVAGPGPRQYAGVTGRWWITPSNRGPYAVDAVVTATFPAGLEPGTPTGATARPGRNGATVLTWPKVSIPAGRPAMLPAVMVRGETPGSYTATATVTPVDHTLTDPTPANNTHTSPPLTVDKTTRTVTVNAASGPQWSDLTPVDVTVKAPAGVPVTGTPVTVSAFGRSYKVDVDANGRGRVNVAAAQAPGTRTRVTASVAATGASPAASGSSGTVTVAKEDAQLWQAPASGRAGRPMAVTVRLLDSSAPGYTGPRRESASTRADVTRSVVAVRIYQGRTLVAATNRKMASIGNGTGQAAVTFTPPRRGTYTVVTSAYTGSWSQFSTLTRTVTVR